MIPVFGCAMTAELLREQVGTYAHVIAGIIVAVLAAATLRPVRAHTSTARKSRSFRTALGVGLRGDLTLFGSPELAALLGIGCAMNAVFVGPECRLAERFPFRVFLLARD
jgi:hypothetical protein